MITTANIDIILNVIDNYGDIGFTCELIAAWRRDIGDDSIFYIWTDQVAMVQEFVDNNHSILGDIYVVPISEFSKTRPTLIVLALFHAPIFDEQYFEDNALVLRIDYLSFDRTWIVHHLDQHILSTPHRQIIEIIPSPLEFGGGLIPHYETHISRYDIAMRYGLDIDKEWVIVFVYNSTLEEILQFDQVPGYRQILLFGSSQDYVNNAIIHMPWVDIMTWHTLIVESGWTVVRGEVSAMASLMRDKLAFWDMYKMIGGFHYEQSEDFLEFVETHECYRDIHNRLNSQKVGGILWSELEEYIQEYGVPKTKYSNRTNNLITEIKKCIDSHEFSI